jgi:F-type H+-transporting ATPase subunit epsilon
MLKLKIVTPQKTLIETEVDSVSLPTPLGEITILPHHIPYASILSSGEIRFKTGRKIEFIAISSGFVEMSAANQVVVLVDTAEFGHEIDLKQAEDARERARTLMSSKDAQSQAQASASFQKQLARIRVARKHRTHSKQNLES